MTIGSAISGIGGLVGSSKGADAAQSGAAAAAAASKEMFGTGLSYEVPWINQGAGYRAPINDALLGGTSGSGYYAGGGVNTMGGAGVRNNGFADMYSDPFIPHTNPGTNTSGTTGGNTNYSGMYGNGSANPNTSGGPVVEGPGFQPAGGTPTSADPNTSTGPVVEGPGFQPPSGQPTDWSALTSLNAAGSTPTTTTTSTTPTTTPNPNAVQGTAYTGSNTLGANTSGSLSFGSTDGGAAYGTVGLGRANLSYNPTDWNAFAGNYSMSPAAQYQMGVGDASVNNSAAAKGGLLSSGDLRNLMTTNQGIVSQDMFKQYGSMLQGQQQDYSQRLASLGLLQSQEAMGANASNAVMTGAVSSGNSQAGAISAGASAASKDYANMFSGFGSSGQNLFGSGGIFGSGNTAA